MPQRNAARRAIALLLPALLLTGCTLPAITMPEMPDIKVPAIPVPEIKVPEIKVPDIKVPDITMPDITMPDITMPDIQPPDLSGVDLSGVAALLPNVEKAQEGGVNVRLRAAPLRIVLAATSAALTVASDAYFGVTVDPVKLLDQVAGVNVVDLPRSYSVAEVARLQAEARAAVAAPPAAAVETEGAEAEAIAEQPAALPAQTGTPPGDVPVLMVISKASNDVLYWQLADEIASVRVLANQPGVEVKVSNGRPLRIELWVDAEVENVDVEVEFVE